ncbi:MAG: 7TM diverse intracellular signaling domain-containing protein [Gammaproteobacteria bacterium]
MKCSSRLNNLIQKALLALLFACVSGTAVPQTLSVNPANPEVSATPALKFLEDTSTELTFGQVRNEPYAGQFRSYGDVPPQIGFSKSAWWVQITLANTTNEDQRLYLRQDYPLIDHLDFWAPDASNSYQKQIGGDRQTFGTRPIEHRNILLPVELKAESEKTVYLRFTSDGPINIGLSLHLEKAMIENVSNSELGIGLYFGGFLVLVIYNIFIFAAVRDRSFIFYLLYLVSYGLYFAVHNGLAFQHFWPNNPWLANQSLLVLLTTTLFFGLTFSMLFLNVKERSQRYYKLGNGLLLILGALFFAVFALPYKITILVLALLSLVTTVLIMSMGIASLLSGYRPARYFMLAWSALLLGVIVYMLKTFGLLPHNAMTHYGFQIGSLIEMTLLSVALSSKVNDIQKATRLDPLTGVGNRRRLDEVLQHEFDRSIRYNSPLALLIGDIDNFKVINDTHGHLKGDEVLRKMAKLMYDVVRKFDTVCRYGGEEFAIVMPNTDVEAAEQFSQRLLKEIESADFGGVKATLSAGLCSVPQYDFSSSKEFFDAADLALYRAKQNGRNQVIVYSPRKR